MSASTTDYDEPIAAVAKMIPYVPYNLLSMPAHIEKAFTFSSLAAFPLKQRILIRLASSAFYFLIVVIGHTIRYEIEGMDNLEQVERDGKLPIYCVWHDRLFAATHFFRNRKIIVMASLSFDGAYIARFLQKLGYGSARGSSTRGGTGALVEMIRLMRSGYAAAFTVDGPRGPRYETKLGPVVLAKKTGNPMTAFILECRRYWTVGSWDRLQIPMPFTRVKLIIDKPIYVPDTASDDCMEEKRLELQHSLDGLVHRGTKWRENGS